MTGDFLGLCEAAKSCIKDGLDLVLACSVCSVFKIRRAAEKRFGFLTEGGFLIKNMYVCQKITVFIKK